MPKQEPNPGSWRPAEELSPDTWHQISEEKRERHPEASEDLVKSYQLFEQIFHLSPKVVYHPSGACDVSPSAAFPNSRVIYVEIDESAVQALKASGYEAYYASASKPINGRPEIPLYKPDTKTDLLILLNPAISHKIPAESLRVGGYIICNDYHDNATEVKKDDQFEFRGVIKQDGAGFVVPDKAQAYWQEVENDEEFQRIELGWGAMKGVVDYETAKDIVEKVQGPTQNILGAYKAILAQAKQEHQAWKVKMALEHPGMEKLNLGEDFALMIHVEGETQPIMLPAQIPTKGGNVDDFFIFQKIKEAKQ